MICDFEKQSYFDCFLDQMRRQIQVREKCEYEELFYSDQGYVLLELYINREEQLIVFKKCRFTSTENTKAFFGRAVELGLPWFATGDDL